jgi:hypothetical protein
VINKNSATTAENFYYTSTVAGLKVLGSSNLSDTLVLDAQLQLPFDFTGRAADANIKGIERIDITGVADTDSSIANNGSTNTIKLNLASLTQADTVSELVNGVPTPVHRLFIDGDSNDAVQMVGFAVTATQNSAFTGYNIYHIDNTHELLVKNSISNVTFI